MGIRMYAKVVVSLLLQGLCSLAWGQLPVLEFRPGKAVLNVEIKSYNPDASLSVKVNIPDLIMMNSDVLFPEISPDGTFRESFQLKHATQVCLRIGDDSQYILMEPGDSCKVCVDLAATDRSYQYVYSGRYAEINNDLNGGKLRLRSSGYEKQLLDQVLELTPMQYRDYCLQDMRTCIAENKAANVCQEAKELANRMYALDALDNIGSCKWVKLYKSMSNDSTLTRPQALAMYKDFCLPEGYYDCLREIPLNDAESLLCYNFPVNIPHGITFNLYEDPREQYQYLLDNAALTREERERLADYQDKQFNGMEYQAINEVMAITMKYDSVYNIKRMEDIDRCKVFLKGVYGKDDLPILEMMDFHLARITFFLTSKPLSEGQEARFRKTVKTPLFVCLLEDKNNSMKPRKRNLTLKSVICENPDVPDNKILDALVDTYKGKILFIDCWATWCSGCLKTMKEYAPLKERYAAKVTFVYLTNETSPLEAWQKKTTEIDGFHYRLGKGQWGYIWERFKLIGVPFYLLINEEGEIVHQFGYITKNEVETLLSEMVK